MKVTAEGITSSLDKTLGAPAIAAIVAATGAKHGDLIVAVSAVEQIPGTDAAALVAFYQLRLSLAEKLSLVPKDRWEFLWLTGFPLFEWGPSEKRWVPAQHPFTGIVEEDIDKLESAPQEVRSKGYDLVLNGVELGSGSIRIHSQELQSRVFALLGLDEQKRRERFRIFPRRADLRDSAARRHRAGRRSHLRVAFRRKIAARSDRLPQDYCGARPDGRCALASGRRPTGTPRPLAPQKGAMKRSTLSCHSESAAADEESLFL